MRSASEDMPVQKPRACHPPLRVTLVYRDPAGVPNTTKHRVNDISLKVIGPSDVYWGNYGLESSNWSTADGSETKEDHVNTVENVFIEFPGHATYTIKVLLTELNADGNPMTPVDPQDPEPSWDAVYALVVSGVATTSPSRADINKDGRIDSMDLLAFVDRWLLGDADLDRDGRTDATDLWRFFDGFFTGQ